MSRHKKGRFFRLGLLVLAISALVGAFGCGRFKNISDDFRDCIILGGGVTPPVLSSGEQCFVAGAIPPSFGVYAQITDLCHLGGIVKCSADADWDRRAGGLMYDERVKMGFLWWHSIRRFQRPLHPLLVNNYKKTGNEMDGWRARMQEMVDPLWHQPAKVLVFDDKQKRRPFAHQGWQNWEIVSLEVAVPEPFLLHSGVNLRAGLDVSEIFDFAFGLVGFDLYGDNAHKFWSGKPRFENASTSDMLSEAILNKYYAPSEGSGGGSR